MQRVFGNLTLLGWFLALTGCGGSSFPLALTVSSSPASISGGGTYTFSATTTNSTTQSGVIWSLALDTPSSTSDSTTPCSSSCGTFVNSGTTVTSQTTSGSTTYYNTVSSISYTAPLTPPTPNEIVLTAAAPTNAAVTADVIFEIGTPAIVVRLSNTFSTISPGAAPVTLNASVQFDSANAGVNWTLAAGGSPCSPACGTLAPAAAPSFSATYTPPATLPAARDNSPTITATSVTSNTTSAFDSFVIQTPQLPISVQITNPFTSIAAGSAGVTVNAQVTNDRQGQGVTWSISPSSNTGSLSANEATSVLYTPPNTTPQPPYNTPTITATSVADPTKSASFTFTIVNSSSTQSACYQNGTYAFSLSGLGSSGEPIAMVGRMSFDNGKVMVSSVDVNDNRQITSGGGISGDCTPGRVEFGAETATITLDSALPSLPAAPFITLVSNLHNSPLVPKWLDANQRRLTGELIEQNPGTFSQFGGDFVFHLAEASSASSVSSVTKGIASVGRFTLAFDGAKGSISKGAIDASAENEGALVTAGSITGTATPPDANGRGTMNLSFAGQGSRAFVYYVASANQFLLAEMDPSVNLAPASVSVFSFPNARYMPAVASGGADEQSLASLPQSAAAFALGRGATHYTYDASTGRFSNVYTDGDGENRPDIIYLTAPDAFWQLNVSTAKLSFSTVSVAH